MIFSLIFFDDDRDPTRRPSSAASGRPAPPTSATTSARSATGSGSRTTYRCYFSIVDWHALSSEYANPKAIKGYVFEVAVDLLSAGLDPGKCVMFLQSEVKEHAELHLLLSMITPLPWLERVPTFKEQQEELADKELNTYGFLGYPAPPGRRHRHLQGRLRPGRRGPGLPISS